MKLLFDVISFLVVVAGGFVASLAFGAESAPALDSATEAFKAIADNPVIVALLSWIGTESATRLFPTRKKRSTLFLVRNLFRFVGSACVVAERVCDKMAESNFAQVRRKPRKAQSPATPASPAEPPREKVG